MFTKLFCKDAIERAISTMAQVALALGGVDGLNMIGLNLKTFLTAVALGGFFSVLKAVAALQLTSGNSASLTVNNVRDK